MNSPLFARIAIGVVAILLGLTTSAQAGPPLICHAIEIGQAQSLPWVDWSQKGSRGYDVKNLTRDTLAILDANTSVLVRMETLRRATIYARQQLSIKDSQAAKELLTRLHARAADSDAAGHTEALAWFDVGYLIETYQQWIGKDEPNPAAGLDGYSLIQKAIRLRGPDPEMEFAAALVTLNGPEADHQDHVRKALAGAKGDPLLARNLASNFNRQTVSELLTDPLAGRI